MRSKSDDDLQPKAWKTVPRWTIAVFLLAAFFIFASCGFVFDGMDMGRQPALCLAFSVVIIALFATFYAIAGITLRRRFWIPSIPLFILENICLALFAATCKSSSICCVTTPWRAAQAEHAGNLPRVFGGRK